MKPITLFLAIFLVGFHLNAQKARKVWLDELDFSRVGSGWKNPQPRKAVDYDTIRLNGKHYSRGVGTHATCVMEIDLHKSTTKFHAEVGVDDKVAKAVIGHPQAGIVKFLVVADGEILFESDSLHASRPPKVIDVNLAGKEKLFLIADESGSPWHDHADWADAWFETTGQSPNVFYPDETPYILTPPAPKTPVYNYPTRVGASAGKPFLFNLPVSGQRPMTFTASGLPKGLVLDASKGIIGGSTIQKGKHLVKITASNALGKTEATLKIEIGDTLALTPPMGWNSWNCWGMSVTQAKVLGSAKALRKSGLADFGWAYINIDDGWQDKRANDSTVITNSKFPNLKGLVDSINGLGLKAGIYSSPGPYTCGHLIGSFKNEQTDANYYAKLGFDYLKYDWCSYGDVAPRNPNLEEMQKPYVLMDRFLAQTTRDIVYSFCQYGMGEVWKWGKESGGNLWRTTDDIVDTWASMQKIGNLQKDLYPYAGPGHWNDPDMLVVGSLGWGQKNRKSRLSPDEQYYHISLWALLASPLLIGCDLENMDSFTYSLLSNREVIGINQDELGKQAKMVIESPIPFSYYTNKAIIEVWMKTLANGDYAVGIFNRGNAPGNFELTPEKLGLKGKYKLRDVWRQQDIKTPSKPFSISRHGAVLLTLHKTA